MQVFQSLVVLAVELGLQVGQLFLEVAEEELGELRAQTVDALVVVGEGAVLAGGEECFLG
jgi:hypothetical protein